jgi:hypothetical protein
MVSWKRSAAVLILFGISFGYVEAAIVVYLRHIYQPLRVQFYPNNPAGELFPLLQPEHLLSAGEGITHLRAVELAREFATLVMFAAVGLAVARTAGQWLAAFAVVFGIWDIFFYVGLKVALDWPASLFTWDILFLLPVPWVGPVVSPLIVAVSMVVGGLWYLHRELNQRPVYARWWHWMGVVLGGFIIILAFTWQHRAIMAGDTPSYFPWPIFLIGLSLGVASFLDAMRRGAPRTGTTVS